MEHGLTMRCSEPGGGGACARLPVAIVASRALCPSGRTRCAWGADHDMKGWPPSLAGIDSFRAVGDQLGTAGQPTQEQFRMVRAAGFEVVINLALPTSDNALANEGSVVTGLGMSYVHIPVEFKAPTAEDFQAFCRVMEAFAGRP